MPSLKSIFLIAFAGFAFSCAKPAEACPALSALVNTRADASAALLDCVNRTPTHDKVELPRGTYVMRKQVRIVKPVTIVTMGIAESAPSCDRLPIGACAVIRLDLDGAPNPNIMLMEIAADHINLRHLIIEGSGDLKLRADCSQPDRRPLGGGMRILNSNFTLRKSILRNFACYTTVEALADSNAMLFEDNLIGPNGDHRAGEIWSDGITVHDSADTIIRRNRFVDNTDVQLILGGCRRCRVEDNDFRHSGPFSKASFAELMLQAFPSTTGNYSGTIVTRNRIDCGRSRLCGYGIMLGSNPWKAGENPNYPGEMFGGTITANTVGNARIGINIDALTGPVEIYGNIVQSSGGRFRSDCGLRDWPAVNIGPGSARFVKGDPSYMDEGSTSTERCILNRQPE